MTYLSGRAEDQPAAADELQSKRVLLFLAQGYEDAEALAVLDILGWTKYRPSVATVDVDITGLHSQVKGAFGSSFEVTVPLSDACVDDYDALAIPGGFHNLGYEEAYCEEVYTLIRAFRQQDKPIATMCVGIVPVALAGALEGGQATTYVLSKRHDNAGQLAQHGCQVVDQPVVDWQGIISCSGPAHGEEVVMRLLEKVAGPEAAAEVQRYRVGLA